jgi:ribosomal protein S27E
MQPLIRVECSSCGDTLLLAHLHWS